VLATILLHAKDLIIVFSLRFLELEFCAAEILLEGSVARVLLGEGFVFTDGVLPGAGFTGGAGTGFARFEIGGIEFEGVVAVIDRVGIFFELYKLLASNLNIIISASSVESGGQLPHGEANLL
jgi:hypothetical protein